MGCQPNLYKSEESTIKRYFSNFLGLLTFQKYKAIITINFNFMGNFYRNI